MRSGRRLIAVFGLVLAGWIAGSWWALDWIVGVVLPH